jgi:hypothetical protein
VGNLQLCELLYPSVLGKLGFRGVVDEKVAIDFDAYSNGARFVVD